MENIFIKEIISPIIYIIIGICIYLIIKNLLDRLYKNKTSIEARKRKTIIGLVKNVVKYVIAIIIILLILEVYNINTGAILASLGVVGLVIGLALQDLIKDLIAGTFIIFDNEYNVGDTVTINNFKGEVISLGLKSTKIKSYEGNVFVIANGKINDVINHTMADNLAIVEVEIAYTSDLEKAIKILDNLAIKLSESYDKLTGSVKVLGVTSLGTNGITVRLVGPCVPLEQYAIERDIRKEIKLVFDKEGIVIPYNQVVVYNGK